MKDILLTIKRKLKETCIESYSIDAEILISNALGLDSLEELFLLKEPPNNKQIELINSFVNRRIKGEPIAYIIGTKPFWDLKILVDKNTLIPRPSTEILVEYTISYIKKHFFEGDSIKIIDLGTGTGCIIITIIKEIREMGINAIGFGVDISSTALAIAKQNIKNANLEDKITLICCDFENIQLAEKFDIIVANPPYIPSCDLKNLMVDVQEYEPHLALDGGIDGLDCYKKIANLIPKISKKNMFIALEYGVGQTENISNILKQNNCTNLQIIKDLSGIDRVISGKF